MRVIRGSSIDLTGAELATALRATAAACRAKAEAMREGVRRHLAPKPGARRKAKAAAVVGRDVMGPHAGPGLFAVPRVLADVPDEAEAGAHMCPGVAASRLIAAQLDHRAKVLAFAADHYRPGATYRVAVPEYAGLTEVPHGEVEPLE